MWFLFYKENEGYTVAGIYKYGFFKKKNCLISYKLYTQHISFTFKSILFALVFWISFRLQEKVFSFLNPKLNILEGMNQAVNQKYFGSNIYFSVGSE
jgi:hypothetical protein